MHAALAATAMWCWLGSAAGAETPAPAQPQPLDHLEERLAWVEKHTDDVVSGRRELVSGLKQLLASKKISATDARQLCETGGDQSKILEVIRGQVVELAKPENQAAMSAAQRKRFAKDQAALAPLTPKLDCSAY